MRKTILTIMIVSLSLLSAQVRIKDISGFSGMVSRNVIGYGLVIGLSGTGDGTSSQMTTQSIKNMVERFGISVPMNKIRPNNVAAVMVTSTIPPFTKLGSTFDVSVSSLGDAKSLQGGTLIMTPLIGADKEQYATAQGAVSIGGFSVSGKKSSISKNFSTTGRIPGGGCVEREVFSQLVYNGELLINLHNPDFTTARRIATAINELFNLRLASAEDGVSVQVIVPDSVLAGKGLIPFVSSIENIQVIPQQKAKVVINERTGTIVAGGHVTISEVAVTHGS
ncbi:MAG: flagellar basal body P-ring protein FlgI, partial [Candidatus Cloacimonetes bacterium]|nr:flagellar basal body P-ring protein FlgI [Candidatus Cloacimonadota bacterium]